MSAEKVTFKEAATVHIPKYICGCDCPHTLETATNYGRYLVLERWHDDCEVHKYGHAAWSGKTILRTDNAQVYECGECGRFVLVSEEGLKKTARLATNISDVLELLDAAGLENEAAILNTINERRRCG